MEKRVSGIVNKHHVGQQCSLKAVVLLETFLGFCPREFIRPSF